MPLSTRIKVYLLALILGNYFVQSSVLIDQFLVSRYVFVAAFNLLGLVFILPKLKHIRLYLFDGLVFAFYLLHLVSSAWAFNFGEAIFTTQRSFVLLLSYLLFRLILDEQKDIKKFINWLVLGLSFLVLTVSTIAVAELAAGDGLADKNIYQLSVWAGHKNLVASYILFLFCYLVSQAKHIRPRPLLVFILIWQLALILIFRSRAVYIALFSFLVIGGIYFAWQQNYRKLIFFRILPAFLILASISVFIANRSQIGQNYIKYLNPTTYRESASSLERQFVWHKTSELIKDQALLGHGSGSWKMIFPSKSIAGGYRLQEKGLVFTRAHNDFLEVWTEIGIIGLLAFLAILGLPVFYSLRTNIKRKEEAVWLSAALVAYAIVSLFDFPKERIEHLVFLALLLASSIHLYSQHLKTYKLNKQYKTAFIVLLLICWLPHLPTAHARLLGDYHTKHIFYYKGKKMSDKTIHHCQQIPDVWYTIDPTTLPISWYEGLAYYEQKKYDLAEKTFEKAYTINPYNFHVINNYASSLTQFNKYEEAIPIYKKALEINPAYEDGIFNLAYSYFQIGEYEQALEWTHKTSKNQEKKQLFIQKITAAQQQQNN